MDATDLSMSFEPSAARMPNQCKTPIAQLAPSLEDHDNRYFIATVSLLWPYSSSQKCLSLLLAEPDPRLRWPDGQVKAIFHGRVAERVAEQRVGIGETICLSLKYGRFVSKEDALQTPRKGVPWDLHFDQGVMLEVGRSTLRGSPSISIHVVPPATPERELPSTPPSYFVDRDSPLTAVRGLWGSPAFHKSSRKSSGTAVDSVFDPFAEEDGYVPGKGRKRPRYSLQRNEWRVLDEPEDPQEPEGEMDWEKVLDEEMVAEIDEDEADDVAELQIEDDTSPASPTEPRAVDMEDQGEDDESSVFAKPRLDLQSSGLFIKPTLPESDTTSTIARLPIFDFSTIQPIDTPQLRPVPSPGLPVPSPLISDQDSSHGYFASIHTAPQMQNLHGTTQPSSEINVKESDSHDQSPISQSLHDSTPRTERPDTQVHDKSIPPSLSQPTNQAETAEDALAESFTTMADANQQIAVDSSLSRPFVAGLSGRLDKDRELESGKELRLSVTAHRVEYPTLSESDAIVEHEEINNAQQAEASGPGIELPPELTSAEPTVNQASEFAKFQESITDETVLHPGIGILTEAAESYRILQDESESDHRNDAEEEGLDDDDAEAESWHMDQEADGNFYPVDEDMEREDYSMDDDAEAESFAESEISDDETGSDDDSGEYEEDDESETMHRQPAGSPDVIVLDSDSDGEDVPEPQLVIADTFEATRPRSETSERSVYSEESQPAPASQFPTADDQGDWPVESGSEAEIVDSQDSEGSDSEEEESEEEESEGADEAHYYENERVRESDLEDESSSSDHIPEEDHERIEQIYDNDVGETSRNPVDVSEEDHAFRVVASAQIEEEQEKEEKRKEEDEEDHEEEAIQDEVGVTEVVEVSQLGSINEPLSHHESAVPESSQNQDEIRTPVEEPNEASALGVTPSSLLEMDGARDWLASTTPTEDPTASQGSHHGSEDAEESLQATDKVSILEDHNQTAVASERIVKHASVVNSAEQFLTPNPTQNVLLETDIGLENEWRKVSDDEKQPPSDTMNESQASLPAEPTSEASTSKETVISLLSKRDNEDDDEASKSSTTASIEPTETEEQFLQKDEPQPSTDDTTMNAPETPVVVVRKASLPNREAQGLRSKLSYFAPLASLADHYNALVDTISIVYEYGPIAKATSGARDYYMTLFLTDPSMAGTTLEARIFRRYKSAMPTVTEGSAILLRDFKPHSHQHSMVLISVDSSSWAVFDHPGPEAKMNGPPVEYGDEEVRFASDLRRWYIEDGAGMVADSRLQASIAMETRSRTPSSTTASDAGSQEGTPSARSSRRARRSHRQVIIHELRDGTRYTEIGSPSGQHGIHELRDGTVYANE
ncbi:hypothetical protein POX_a00502 [Penicillium oxalicum]|uniref:hypothetical protein n=1 Tax=Penicillium oxalicum TaxID=69781 RepID=UPI0020B7C49E|nr:hypothetical protein POX_a00502 [Penicillium oxalicum]KAI2793914.1 hypothetical protein POX_a00502 [Penicillium oxalicum]